MSDGELDKATREGMNLLLKEFKGESDRAVVIIGAAKLDYLLYQILCKFLMPNPGGDDPLFDGDAPLSSFSAKISLCYRLGIIDASYARALHIIRKIRNSFAHESSGCDLNSGRHRDRIIDLVSPIKDDALFISSKQVLFHSKSGTAADFFTALTILAFGLHEIHRKIKRIDISPDSTLLPSIRR